VIAIHINVEFLAAMVEST